ncbi:MAG TPA: carboxypeptidase-like regulatory domain-containing protein, partial [Acidobacteriaceae bacterium]
MRRFFVCVLSILFAAFFAVSALHAQDASAVTGVVSDTNGAVIAGAEVTLVNTTTRAAYSGKTNSLGSYRIVNVTPGPGYKLTFKMAGFGQVVVNDVYLTVATTRTQNATLKPGAVTTEVEVSAANSEVTLNTTDATIGNNFDVKLLDQLPIQVRNTPASLFALQPGITKDPDGEYSITGARTDQTYVTVDGLDVNDISTGQSFLLVADAPVDSVQEFRGTVAGQLASAGPGGGGQFQLVTKSGTNSWHGNVNLYHRDTSTVANDWFNDRDGVSLAHYVRNQFGGNIGGPIKKDKAFFFFNFFDLRLAHSTSVETIVPTKSFAGGNISYILANASNGSGGCSFTSRLNTTPQCIGTLTPAQVKALDPAGIGFSSVVQSFLNSRYPAPNDPTAGDGINTQGYRFNAPKPDDETNYVARFDYTINPTMKFFAKFGMNREDAIEFPQVLPADPVAGNPIHDRSYDYVLGHTWTIGSTKINQFSYGDTIEKFNFPANYAPTGTTVLAFGALTNATFLGNPYNEQETQKRRLPIPVVRDDFNWLKGAHSLGFGGSFKFIKTESEQKLDFNFLGLGLGSGLPGLDPSVRPTVANGYVSNPIRGGTTAPFLYDNAFALALGHIADVTTNYNYNNAGVAYPAGSGHVRRYRYYQTELYFGDTWKANKALTLTYGVNYQYYSVPYETSGLESIQNFDFDTYFADRVKQSAAGNSGAATVPFITYNLGGKANNAAPLFQPNRKDFSPRFSFAYNPSYLPKTVFNGGAGVIF